MESDPIDRPFSCRKKLHNTLHFLFRIFLSRIKKKESDKYRCLSKTTIQSSNIRPSLTLSEKSFSYANIPFKQVPSDTLEGFNVDARTRDRFLNLPPQVRQIIYEYLGNQDLLSIRLTSRAFKRDVESCHGLCFRLHDGTMEYERSLQTLGIQKLTVENFTEGSKNLDSYLPYPELLGTIIITGPISAANFEFLLNLATNLKRIVINFQTPDMAVTFGDNRSLDSLKILEITSSICAIVESSSISCSIREILNDLDCPNLSSFEFNLSAIIPERIRLYHKWTNSFILRNSSKLRRVKIEIKQIMGPFTGVIRDEEEDDMEVRNDWIENDGTTRLEDLHLSVNNNVKLWYPVIDSQTRLRSLHLDMTNQSWTRLILVLGKSVRFLRHLSISGLLSLSREGTTALPVDFGFLRNLKQLETLAIHHEITESAGLNPPIVLRTSLLPQTLKSVKLCQLRLKPHQPMFLLLKLPNIQNVELDSWTDSENTLEAFLAVLTFLIKFELTPVTSFMLTDSRIRMENQSGAILKMKTLLQNKAFVIQSNYELYSRLIINCFKFN